MAQNPSREIFVNIPVRDLKRSMEFFSKLGFELNPTKRELCNASSQTEGIYALSCASRAEVDELVKRAIAAGGKHAMDPMDHGFMYGWSFYDPDGHHWEVLWMDPKGFEEERSGKPGA